VGGGGGGGGEIKKNRKLKLEGFGVRCEGR